jgi:hypothetical protein
MYFLHLLGGEVRLSSKQHAAIWMDNIKIELTKKGCEDMSAVKITLYMKGTTKKVCCTCQAKSEGRSVTYNSWAKFILISPLLCVCLKY